MTVTAERSLSDRVLDLAVYAPIGFAAHLRDQHEAYVAAGRERFGQTVEVARFLGKVVVERGQGELRKRFGRPDGTASTVTIAPEPPAPFTAGPVTSTATGPADAAPSSIDLPLADYDSLAASQVVLRLDDLQPAEIEAVRAYEAAHRGRRTILSKIAQLQGS